MAVVVAAFVVDRAPVVVTAPVRDGHKRSCNDGFNVINNVCHGFIDADSFLICICNFDTYCIFVDSFYRVFLLQDCRCCKEWLQLL